MNRSLPRSFVWGAATSAYQIEGAWQEDGRSESIWDRFSHTPGRIRDGSTGDVACDHYHRWEDDVALMAELGLTAYRFSVAWPRILPDGRGEVNAKGLAFYDRLVDRLLEAGIEPFLTLYHWDLPQTLQDAGGWPERSTHEAFVEFADRVSARLGDRVRHWITVNEPWVAASHGYQSGVHAPGRRDEDAYVASAHHMLLAHGRSVEAIRANCAGAEIGIAVDLAPQTPLSDSAADRNAATLADGRVNRWFLDPLVGRGYPQDVVEADQVELRCVRPGDLETIAAEVDFLGVNYYSHNVVGEGVLDPPDDRQWYTEMGWKVYPEGMTETLRRLHADYRFPSYYVTENGAAFRDTVDECGQVIDADRIRYLDRHLEAIRIAAESGVPVRGNFVWSLLDNFEWGEGMTKRFGLVFVDFDDQRRIVKASGDWYRRAAAANALPPNEEDAP